MKKYIKDIYFTQHPDSNIIYDGNIPFPADKDGNVVCARQVGLVSTCGAGEGFYDCRDCWSEIYIEDKKKKDDEFRCFCETWTI